MDIIKKIEFLLKAGDVVPVNLEKAIKIFNFRFVIWRANQGWLHIEDKQDYYSIMWTTDKETHSRAFGTRAHMIDLDKATGKLHQKYGFSGAWESAISMWPVKEEEDIKRVFNIMKARIDIAYEWQKNKRPE